MLLLNLLQVPHLVPLAPSRSNTFFFFKFKYILTLGENDSYILNLNV